ncbi:hypothetical protein [Candidatus Laterigemmans baculatus]|uniref:hypothetical protein n=1 Tax=Candidatus Laterigemmans baculatus TaxID=2770505 RepID=UPI0013DA3D60|nr:hypothetical protein [Candidatus Laterigemmans baculatus]
MNRIKGLLRETWWLWTLFFVAIVVLSASVSSLFLFMAPALLVVFTYFAHVRYDEHGNPKEEL